MNKINKLFSENKERKLLSLYFCAGCPTLDGTADVILTMQKRGIDMIEVGIPFSDPLADGPVIQSAGTVALKNGMTLKHLFAQLKSIKDQVQIPLVMMGYLNVIMHYGIEKFCQSCVECGVSGMIIPDLPFAVYKADKRGFIHIEHGGKFAYFAAVNLFVVGKQLFIILGLRLEIIVPEFLARFLRALGLGNVSPLLIQVSHLLFILSYMRKACAFLIF